jgi:hypothetical protein
MIEQPDTLNLASKLNYQFGIKRLPTLNFFVQGVTLPGLASIAVDTVNPFTNIREQGEHVQYDELVVDFLVDEKLTNWLAIHRWIEGYTFPEEFQQYADLKAGAPVEGLGLRSDLFVTVENSIRRTTLEFVFRDAFPVRLTSLDMSSTTDFQYLNARVSFAYTKFDIVE